MKVCVFGNQDLSEDNVALEIAEELSKNVENVEFVFVEPNEDVPFANEERVVIMDVVEGINKVKVFNEGSIDRLILSPRTSVHDFDLGFQLKYLKKLGKLNDVVIIGLPRNKKVSYSSIQSILRKLVAQDIQGS